MMIIKLSLQYFFLLLDIYGPLYSPGVVQFLDKYSHIALRKRHPKKSKINQKDKSILMPKVRATIMTATADSASLIKHIALKITDIWFFQWLKAFIKEQPKTKIMVHDNLITTHANSFVVGSQKDSSDVSARQKSKKSLKILV